MKKLLVLLLTVFALNSCEEDTTIIDATAEKKLPKVDVCHYDADTDTWKTISINENALKAHLKHGDYEGECCDGLTYVPDELFEKELIRLGYDAAPLDHYVLTCNIMNVKYLELYAYILDLTGIEGFKSLNELNLNYLKISTLDISKNLELQTLNLRLPNLKSLDLSFNTELKQFWSNGTPLEELDVTSNVNLESLGIYYNENVDLDVKISHIDLSKNLALSQISLGYTDVTSLDITNNINLKKVSLHTNNIPRVDFSKNILLERLLFSEMPFVELDVTKNLNLLWIQVYLRSDSPIRNIDLSKNLKLEKATFISSPLENLDLSNNIALTDLQISGFKYLKSLNLKNGNNKAMSPPFITRNPNLYCIQVDDATWSNGNWTLYDSQSYFSNNCGY